MITKTATRGLAAVVATAALGLGAQSAQAAGTNIIDTVAGYPGLAATDGPALQRSFITPTAVAGTPDGGFLVADRDNYRIRKAKDGMITTVAGGGSDMYSNGIPATQAYIWRPSDVEPTPDGGFLVVEPEMNRVRKVGADGKINTVAGNGSLEQNTGNEGPATQAGLYYPWSVAMHPDGGFVISQPYAYRVRRVTPDGKIHLILGDGTQDWREDQPGPEVGTNFPYGVDVSADGKVYVAEDYGAKIRVIDTDGVVHRFAGTGYAGHAGDEGAALDAHTGRTADVAVAPDGRVLFSQTQYWYIRRVTADGTIHTVAGNGYGGYTGDGGLATQSAMGQPAGVGFASDGDLLLTDLSYNKVRRVDTGYEAPSEEPGGDEEQPGGGDEEQPGGGDEEQPGGGDEEQPGGGDEEQPGGGDEEQPGGGDEEQPGGGDEEQPGGEQPGGDQPHGGTEQPGVHQPAPVFGQTPPNTPQRPTTIEQIIDNNNAPVRPADAPLAISAAKRTVRIKPGRRAKVTLTTPAGRLAIEVRRGTKLVTEASRQVAAGKVDVKLPAVRKRGRYIVRLLVTANGKTAETTVQLVVK